MANPATDQILTTALVNISNGQGNELRSRLLLDTGSSGNFITEITAQKLHLKRKPCTIPVSTLNGMTTHTKHIVTATIHSTNGKFKGTFEFLTIPTIGTVPTQTISRESIKIPRNLKLADVDFHKPNRVDLLLGAGPSLQLLSIGQYALSPELTLQKTQLGWVIGGSISDPHKGKHPQLTMLCTPPDFNKFWDIEEGPHNNFLSFEEQAVEEHFIKNYYRDSSGRYVVALPFNHKHGQLGESRDIALRRFRSLENRLLKEPQTKEQYSNVIQEYLDLSHMTKINSDTHMSGVYLPHHAVFKEASTTTKLRVVFDGSAKTSTGISLNETLMVGPTIQDDLFSHVIRFRFHRFVLTGDIEKMYRQFLIRPEDRSYQQILWRDENNQIATYQLNTVTFGLSAAPFLAIRSLQQVARDNAKQYPTASHILQRDMYVDDLLTGFESIEAAIEAQKQITNCLQRAGLNIRQWASNNIELLQHLPAESINQRLQLGGEQTLKALGVVWDAHSDTINYIPKKFTNDRRITKRSILSEVATIFDPLGLLGPVILLAKHIIQKLWEAKVDWDESVPTSIHTLWTTFCVELPQINKAIFRRYISVPEAVTVQLHGFCDASEIGYGACIYVRSIDHAGHIHTALLCSKSKVAPLNTVSIPRLELCAALTLTKLYGTVKRALNTPITEIFCWTDSMIVLHWIQKSPHLLHTFVANRVSEIQTEKYTWRHVTSEDNPADALSRGQRPAEFIQNTRWITGPTWLREPETRWQWKTIESPSSDNETKKIMSLTITPKSTALIQLSSWPKIIRFVAIWRRFLMYLRFRQAQPHALTAEELRSAELAILRMVQRETFSEALKDIRDKAEKPTRNNSLWSLNPFIDQDGVLRVGGRLQNASIPFDQKHPIILPKQHHITEIIMRETHQSQLHAGTLATLYAMRQRFWPIDGRNQVRRMIRNCVTCVRAKPSTCDYQMGNLPSSRVIGSLEPFSTVGVDYCGPFHVKERRERNRGKVKVYVCVFVCMAVKAVHLEVVSDLSTEGFIGALRRFIGRRGRPHTIQSDNGTNFVGANNELKKIVSLLQEPINDSKINAFLSERGINWLFSPPSSPHFGGIWEAAVKSFKHHLRRVIGNELFDEACFTTLVVEIEGILNSRPLTPMSSDPNDIAALTPGHFLIGKALTTLPETPLNEVKIGRLSRWQHIQKVRQDFWTRWHKEYLNELNVRRKWIKGDHSLKINSLVLVKDDNLPSLQWKMGRVVELFPGQDGVTRVAVVKTTTGLSKRCIRRLVPLPIQVEDESNPINENCN